MTDLRTITKDIHDAAERTALSQMLISGDFNQHEWATFLANQMEAYQAIERRNIITLPSLLRVPALRRDLDEVAPLHQPRVLNSTWRYVEHIKGLSDDLVWSHIYVRYLGDLFGGQMIKRAAKWPCNHLDFEDKQACMQYLRQNTANADPGEAVNAFKMVIDVYEEMHELLRPST